MPAILLDKNTTPFQRIILEQLLQPAANMFWLGSGDQQSLRLEFITGSSRKVIFYGSDLQLVEGKPVGSVNRIEILDGNFPYPSVSVADVTGLDIGALDVFIANALSLTAGEPDFSSPAVNAFYAAITPKTIKGSDDDNFIEAGSGVTNINAGGGNDVVLAGPGGGSIKMGSGSQDAVDFRNLLDAMDADLATGDVVSGETSWTLSGVTHLFGSEFGDTIEGSGEWDIFFGRGGADTVRGLAGDDTINGDAGSDFIFGGADSDYLYGGNGIDSLFGGFGVDSLYGGSRKDILKGGQQDDLLVGGDGNDKLYGGRNSDTLEGGDHNDRLFGGGGGDDVFGGAGSDIIFGQAGLDTMFGGLEDDSLFGGIGRDELTGGAGDDVLTGGGGSDIFHFTNEAQGNDVITDFNAKRDTIQMLGQLGIDVDISKVTGSSDQYRVVYTFGEILVIMNDSVTALTLDEFSFG